MGLEYSYSSFGVPEVETRRGLKLPPDKNPVIRSFDDSGNVFQIKSKIDKKYGKGGQLQTFQRRKYEYNDCGDLIKKTEFDELEVKGKVAYHGINMIDSI